jgi:hypothetical protein
VIHYALGFERSLAAGKRDRHVAVALQLVLLQGVVAAHFRGGRNVSEHLPVTHERLQVKLCDHAKGGWFEPPFARAWRLPPARTIERVIRNRILSCDFRHLGWH